jgi:hypothetical protein
MSTQKTAKLKGERAPVEESVARWRSLLPQAVAILPVSASEGPNGMGIEVLRRILMGGEDVPGAIETWSSDWGDVPRWPDYSD